MFVMKPEQHTYICRSVFLLGCLAPTLYVAFYIVFLRPVVISPLAKAAWEKTVSEQIGLDVRFDSVESRPHDVTRLHALQLLDPETGRELLHSQYVDVAHTEQGWVLLATSPKANLDGVAPVWATIHERLLRRRVKLDEDVHLIARELVVQSHNGATQAETRTETFVDIDCRLRQTSERTEFSLQFRQPSNDLPGMMKFVASREIQDGAVTPTTVRFDNANSTPLPCWLIASPDSSLAVLGEQAEFQGQINLTLAPTGSQGEVDGRLSNVDLETLVTHRFPQKLSGVAEIETFHPAKFVDGRLVEASGAITSEGGVVGADLLQAAAQMFPLQVSRELPRNSPYEKLAVGFHISTDGLRLSGNCGAPGVLLSDGTGPLLVEHGQRDEPVISLVRMLAPVAHWQVPATQETAPLLRALPIPSVVGAATAQELNREKLDR